MRKSEAIAYVREVWGKAVALPRYQRKTNNISVKLTAAAPQSGHFHVAKTCNKNQAFPPISNDCRQLHATRMQHGGSEMHLRRRPTIGAMHAEEHIRKDVHYNRTVRGTKDTFDATVAWVASPPLERPPRHAQVIWHSKSGSANDRARGACVDPVQQDRPTRYQRRVG
jgi:hypothetical protein